MTCFRKVIPLVSLIVWGWLSAGWAAEPLSVFVSIAPQHYFVQQIGKERVAVQALVEPGADPHTYEPKPQQMVALSTATLYFAVGIEFEAARLPTIAAMNPRMQVVHTDHGILKLPMAAHDHDHAPSHTHGQARPSAPGHHRHGGLDPHIWLSPPLVMQQARTILTALQAVDPAHRDFYETNYRAFLMELEEMDAHLRSVFDRFRGAPFMVVHPSWGTFAHTYGLEQVPIEIEGKHPKPAQIQTLIERARAEGIKVVFVQPQFSAKTAEQIAKAIDGRVVVVDPLAREWATNLRQVAKEFADALQ